MLLSERLRITPFLKILPCFAAGIFAFGYVTAPDWVIVSATIVCYLLAWALRKSVWGGCYSAAALFMCGILVTAIAATREVMPRGVRLAMVLEVNDTPVSQGRWQRTTADVGSFRRTDAVAGTWTPTDERIELRVDTSMRVAVGDQLCVTGYLNSLDTTGSRYGKLMRSRGISARTYVVENGIVARLEGNGRRLIRTASMLHQAAVDRIAQLNIDDVDKDMIAALVAGEKRAFDPRLKEEYSRTGVAHILAVSGLHMGFVLIIANMLFGWLVLFRRGHILKNVLVILALWLYAVMAGLSMEALDTAFKAFLEGDESAKERVEALNKEAADLGKSIVDYLIRISSEDVMREDEKTVSAIHHATGDILRIGELADNVTKYTDHYEKDGLIFSGEFLSMTEEMYSRIKELSAVAYEAYLEHDFGKLRDVDELEESIDQDRRRLVNQQITRLNEGTCQPDNSSVFINLVGNLERAADHITYIAHSIE